MANYFNIFPKTVYSLKNTPTSVDIITNLTSKFTISESFKNNNALYYEYVVTDGETPEMLAHKIYGNSERHWIILAMNDIFNIVTDWPSDNRTINNIIENKYVDFADVANNQTGLEWSQSNVHSYYEIETQSNPLTTETFVRETQIDHNTYSGIVASSSTYTLADGNTITIKHDRKQITYYDYEMIQNDNKRTIKILNPELLTVVEEEFKRVFK